MEGIGSSRYGKWGIRTLPLFPTPLPPLPCACCKPNPVHESNNLFQLMIILAYHKRSKQRMNQSELEENTCKWGQARENACEQVTIIVLLLIGRESFLSCLYQSQSEVKQKQRKRKFLSILTESRSMTIAHISNGTMQLY